MLGLSGTQSGALAYGTRFKMLRVASSGSGQSGDEHCNPTKTTHELSMVSNKARREIFFRG